MGTVMISALLLSLLPQPAGASQIVAGSQEEKVFQEITAETNGDAKLQKLAGFEKQFPRSRVLPNIYLMTIDLYREKNDTDRVIEYAEKVLKIDERNITAMMILSRSYAIQRKHLDRAVEFAQKAVDEIGRIRSSPAPTSYTASQWKEYLDSTEASARSILAYTTMIRGQ